MSLQDELDDASSSGMSIHDVMSVHGDGTSVDMEGNKHRDDSDVYFEFIDAQSKLVWDLQVIVASWLMNIEQNEYTSVIRQDIDKLMIDITMAGSALEMMSQSQSFKQLRDYNNMKAAMEETIGRLTKDYIELKPIVNRMLMTT